MPLRGPEGDPGVLWACADHAEALRRDDIFIRKIFRMCGLADRSGYLCEKLATHVLVSEVRGHLLLNELLCRPRGAVLTPPDCAESQS